jgi:PKD repeat protein
MTASRPNSDPSAPDHRGGEADYAVGAGRPAKELLEKAQRISTGQSQLGMTARSPHGRITPGPARVRCPLGVLLALLALAASGPLAVWAGRADAAVVPAAPTWPIPSDAPAGPPPIAAFPGAAGPGPPAAAIADPVTANAVCGGWHQQSNYGDRWPASSSWWEYSCSYEDTFYDNPCTSGACNAFCWYCTWETQDWTEYFYWDGSNAVFYGEAYSDSLVSEGDLFPPYSSTAWWDGPTAQWYRLGSYSLTVSKDGAGSGAVSSSPPGISCGASCRADFDAGTVVTLTATPDASSSFTGWSGDCSGSGSCQVTIGQTRSVTASFGPKPNQAPQASFTISCSALTCSFDADGSSDCDGSIAAHSWDFGDGTSGNGKSAQHSYSQTDTYTVSLTVTDDDGATDTTSTAVALIHLAARGYKLKGLQTVELSWNRAPETSYDVYRDGTQIATVSAGNYTDNLKRKGFGSYTYKLCAPGPSTICSNQATVSF